MLAGNRLISHQQLCADGLKVAEVCFWPVEVWRLRRVAEAASLQESYRMFDFEEAELR